MSQKLVSFFLVRNLMASIAVHTLQTQLGLGTVIQLFSKFDILNRKPINIF